MDEMKNRNAISDEKLETVTGGDVTIDGQHYSGYVDKYHAVAGQEYYLVNPATGEHAYGTLVKSWEKDDGIFSTKRTHTIRITESASYGIGGIVLTHDQDFSGDDFVLYTTMNYV